MCSGCSAGTVCAVTLPAYIDIEFDTINGLALSGGLLIAVSTTALAPSYTAPPPGSVVGVITTSYTP